jgi:hypothetical protein
MVQASITPNLECIILAKNSRKKIYNIQQNNKVWLTFDATGLFRIPKVIYIKGKAVLEPLTQESFEDFLSYHGIITKLIYRRLTVEGLEDSTKITVKPEKVLTVGIFGKAQDIIFFRI